MKRLLLLLLLAVMVSPLSFAQSAEDLFQQANQIERVEGDLQGAIELLERVVDSATDRGLAARALLRIGENYEKLGRDNAADAYQRIVDQFSDQETITASAKGRLVHLRMAASSQTAEESSERSPFSQSSVELSAGMDWWGSELSPSGALFAVSDTDLGGVSVIEVETGIRRNYPHPTPGQNGYVQFVSFSSDESSLAIGQWEEEDPQATYVRMVDLASGKFKQLLDVDEYFLDELGIAGRNFDPYPLAWTSDGDSVVTILEYNLRLPAERDSLNQWYAYLVNIPIDGGKPRIISGPEDMSYWSSEQGCLTEDDRFLLLDMGNKPEEGRGWYVGMVDMITGELRPWRKKGGNHSIVGCYNSTHEAAYVTRMGDYSILRRGNVGDVDQLGGDRIITTFNQNEWHVGFSMTGDLAMVNGRRNSNMGFASFDPNSGEWQGDMDIDSSRPMGQAAHWTPNGDGFGWLAFDRGQVNLHYRDLDGSSMQVFPLEEAATWFTWGSNGESINVWESRRPQSGSTIRSYSFPSMELKDSVVLQTNALYMFTEQAIVYSDKERNCLIKESFKSGKPSDFHCFPLGYQSWGLQPNEDESKYLLGIMLPDSSRVVATIDPDGTNYHEVGRFDKIGESLPSGFGWLGDQAIAISWNGPRWPYTTQQIERVDLSNGARMRIGQRLLEQYDVRRFKLHPEMTRMAADIRPKTQFDNTNYLTIHHNIMSVIDN